MYLGFLSATIVVFDNAKILILKLITTTTGFLYQTISCI